MAVCIELPEREPLPRLVVLAFMAQFCMAAKQDAAAKGYLLELLAHCAFGGRQGEGDCLWV